MTPRLHIRLLGGFALEHEGAPVPGLNAARLQSLLAYLLLQDQETLSRQQVAFLFWPDLPEDQARNNLRQALHQLRRLLPTWNRFMTVDASTVGWRRDAPAWLDVAEFRDALNSACEAAERGQPNAQRSALEKAVTLFHGELLPSCYDDWIGPERDGLNQDYLEALESLVGLLEARRDYSAAIQYARRLVQHDALHEGGYRLLMRLCALSGDRAGALRAYHACADTLERELGVEPDAETGALYRHLLHTDDRVAAAEPPRLLSAPPLVGRDNSWSELVALWRQAASGAPRLVVIEGDAGIGKTRLAEEFCEWAARQGISTIRTRAYAAEGSMSYGPLVDWLRSDACRPVLANMDAVWRTEVARLLPELLVEAPDLPRPDPMTEHWQRQRFFESLARVVTGVQQPLVLLLDDLHWCDRETIEWLRFLLRFDPRARMMVIGTARIEELAGHANLQALLGALHHAEQASEIALEPLDAAEAARLAAHVSGAELSTGSALQLYRETEGNPLFVVETMRLGLLPAKSDPVADFAVGRELPPRRPPAELPPKVHTVIAGRLNQLSEPARSLACTAATIGRAFTFEALVRAGDADEDMVVQWLNELWERRIVREIGSNQYDFTHDKLREVAYAEMGPPARARLHHRVAESLEAIHAGNLDAVSGQLAAHFERAGLPERAISFYHRAALVAQRVGANDEAIGLLRRALALLPGLGIGPKSDAMELDLQLALGAALVGSLGHGAPEVASVYTRAETLREQLGRPPSAPVLRALALFHIVKAEFDQTRQYGQRLIALADAQSDAIIRVEGNYVLGAALSWEGEFETARTHFEAAIADYDPRQARIHIASYSQDPKVICLCRLAFNLWHLGYPDQAANAAEEAMTYAQKLAHPFSQAYAMCYDARLQNLLRAFTRARDRAETMIAHCREQEVGFWLPCGMTQKGWALTELGEVDGGMALIQAGLDGWQSIDQIIERPLQLAILGEERGKAGDPARGLVLVDQALALVEQHDMRWCEAEVYRRRAVLLALRGDVAAAEDAYRRAIAVAEAQNARMPELRALTGLARLLRHTGNDSSVRRSLARTVAWFREGLDLPDLRDARALL